MPAATERTPIEGPGACLLKSPGTFVPPPVPADEAERLASLHTLKIVDTPAEERFDRITRLAARLLEVPIAYVAIIDADRQWYKSRVGFDLRDTSRDISFCGYAILQDEMLVIPDARSDERFANHPQVIGEPFVRFYAGQQLRGPNGFKVGTLCTLDVKPRTFSDAERELLKELGELVERELSLTEMIGYQHEILRVKEELIQSQRDLARTFSELELEKKKSDDLLLNILPESVAAELKNNGHVKAVHYDCASVMFTDFVGFTRISERLTPQQLVDELHFCFSEFDRITARYNVEKLKTIGDGYMCVTGIPHACTGHAHDMVRAAIEIRDFMRERKAQLNCTGEYWDIRIGIHSGPVVAGVVGVNKFAYDIWGDTVNIASRFETNSEQGRINISQATFEQVRDFYVVEPRGMIEVRNKQPMEMFFLEGPCSGGL